MVVDQGTITLNLAKTTVDLDMILGSRKCSKKKQLCVPDLNGSEGILGAISLQTDQRHRNASDAKYLPSVHDWSGY